MVIPYRTAKLGIYCEIEDNIIMLFVAYYMPNIHGMSEPSSYNGLTAWISIIINLSDPAIIYLQMCVIILMVATPWIRNIWSLDPSCNKYCYLIGQEQVSSFSYKPVL